MSILAFGFQRETDKNIFKINDTTVWGPELPRADYDLYLFTSRYDKIRYSPVENTPDFPLAVVSSWTVTADVDGSYMAVMAAAPVWLAIGYQKDSLVSIDQKIYRALAIVPAGTAVLDIEFWLPVETSKDLPLMGGSPNAHIKIDYFLHDANALICMGEKSIAYAGGQCKCSDECDAIKDWAWTMIFYNASVYSQGFGEFEEAGKFMDNVNARCGIEVGQSPCNC